MVAVLAEVLNFVTMLSLFANSPIWSALSNQERVFEVWLFVEALVIMCTVAANVLYVLIRSFQRETINIEAEPARADTKPDYNKDFLSSENNQFLISLLNQCCGPLLVYGFFKHYFSDGGAGLTPEIQSMLD